MTICPLVESLDTVPKSISKMGLTELKNVLEPRGTLVKELPSKTRKTQNANHGKVVQVHPCGMQGGGEEVVQVGGHGEKSQDNEVEPTDLASGKGVRGQRRRGVGEDHSCLISQRG